MANKQEERKLTEAEKRRQEAFERKKKEYEEKGYEIRDLTTTQAKANVVGVLYGFLLALPFAVIFFVTARDLHFASREDFLLNYVLFLAAIVILTVVHELIHGFTWSRFAPNGFKSIEFGVMWQSLNPYCTCSEPLSRNQYILGCMMPCIVLGIVPSIIAILTHSMFLLMIGVIMTAAAGGDILITLMILQNRTDRETLYLDHPTAIGLVRFEKAA